MYEEIVKKAIADLQHRRIREDIDLFGGHPLQARIDREDETYNLITLWCEFIRITLPDNSSLVFRLLTREGLVAVSEAAMTEKTPKVVLDNRPNVHREVAVYSRDDAFLLNAYIQLLNNEVDAILTPVREASLGVTEEVSGIEPFTTEERRYPDDVEIWDIQEEIDVAAAINREMLGARGELLLTMQGITDAYTSFALPLVDHLSGEIQALHPQAAALPTYDSETVDFSFYNPEIVESTVNLGLAEQRVEQMVAYPYPTEEGMLYIRLMKVWNAEGDKFSVVRVIQTQPTLDHIDGMRIDSNCTDGVHNLDCHCDCCEQLWQVLKLGLREGKNIMVIEEEDHEGKGHGTVMKGTTLRITREINENLAAGERPKGTAFGSDLLYTALNRPADLRSFNGAGAVLKALGITEIDTLLMGNREKVEAVTHAGVKFSQSSAVNVPEAKLTDLALQTLYEKHIGLVRGVGGKVISYTHDVA